MLKNSEAAWNRGDMAAFASDYEDAPTTTFVGREVTRGGVDAILARYRRSYPTAETRGTLTFSEIEVRPLGEGYALALGRFALKRTPAGGATRRDASRWSCAVPRRAGRSFTTTPVSGGTGRGSPPAVVFSHGTHLREDISN